VHAFFDFEKERGDLGENWEKGAMGMGMVLEKASTKVVKVP